jgi:hypothetical protein
MEDKEKTMQENAPAEADKDVKGTETAEAVVENNENEKPKEAETTANEGKNTGESGEKPEKQKEPKERTFTQAEVDELIKQRLGREAKKTAQSLETMNAENAALKRVNACYKAGIREESVEDVIALATRYVDEEHDFDAAIKLVTDKYPDLLKKTVPVKTGVKAEDKETSISDKKLLRSFGVRNID